MGRLAGGEDLLQGLLSVCHAQKVRCATLSGSGVLEELAIAHYDASSRAIGKPRWFRTPMQLLALTGTLTEHEGKADLRLNVTASRQGDNGIELLGGLLAGGRVLTCEFVIDALDDVLVRRGVDRRTGLAIWQEFLGGASPGGAGSTARADAGKAAPPGAGGGGASPAGEGSVVDAAEAQTQTIPPLPAAWQEAIQASADALDASPEDDEEEEIYRPIKSGDFLDHRKFGRCVIERVDANEELITVRLRNDRRIRLNVAVLNLRFSGEEGGHQIFVARSAAE